MTKLKTYLKYAATGAAIEYVAHPSNYVGLNVSFNRVGGLNAQTDKKILLEFAAVCLVEGALAWAAYRHFKK